MGNTPTTLCCRCKEREESHSHYIFHYKLSQNTLNFINEIINHSYDFQSPFKIGIKDILMGTSCHTHDGVKLEILLTLIEVFLRHLSFCQRKTFYEDGYNKINELSNYKGNLISRFNTLRDMAIELDLKESFLKKWNLLINLNGTLNVKNLVSLQIPLSTILKFYILMYLQFLFILFYFYFFTTYCSHFSVSKAFNQAYSFHLFNCRTGLIY